MVPIRVVVLFFVILGAGVEYVARVNINVAMVSMVKESNTSKTNNTVCKVPQEKLLDIKRENNSLARNASTARQFDWDPELQGIILGSYFYSYVLTQFPAGRMAERFGAKYIVGIGLLGSSVINFITPLVAGSVPLLILSLVILGFVQGGVFPACFQLICKWLPQKEKPIAIGFMDVGINMGSIVSAPLTGFLCDSVWGWDAAFYVSGVIVLVVFALFSCFVTSEPEGHFLLSKRELNYIKRDVNGNEKDGKSENKPALPLRQILTSRPVIVAIIARFSLGWTFLMFQTKLPAYLNDILHMSTTKVSLEIR